MPLCEAALDEDYNPKEAKDMYDVGMRVEIYRGIIYRGGGRGGISTGYGVVIRVSPKRRSIYVRTDFCTSPVTFTILRPGASPRVRRVKGGQDLWLV